MENLSNISVVKALMERHGVSFSKTLGQNFLINPSVCPKIAELGGAQKGFGILEIGAGVGVLTVELARRADKVVCIEIDTRLMPVLKETLAEFDNVGIIHGDVLKTDLRRVIAEEFAGLSVAVCANLPYYITSPVIMSLLEAKLPIESITVMVQKEAAARICAPEGSRESGAISVAVRYYSEPKVLFQVSRGSFLPAPDVDSSVIRLEVRKQPPYPVKDEKVLFALIKAAFSQRRKTLVNAAGASLAVGGRSVSKSEVAAALEKAGVPVTARAEQLTLAQFCVLAGLLAE